jgi:transposase
MTKENQPSDMNQQARSALLAASRSASQAMPLVESFQTMVRERKAKKLDLWLQQADASELVEFPRFACSLRQDYQAMYCGLSEKWSNGQIEGQVNRLKFVKRTMYAV